MNDWYQKHLAAIESNAFKIDQIYKWAIHEASQIGATVTSFNPDKPFSFADYPGTKNRIDKLTQSMTERIQGVVVNGTTAAWENSNFANNELAKGILSKMPVKGKGQIDLFSVLDAEAKAEIDKKYFNNNEDALKAFISRKTAGMNLSDRVWKYTDQFKQEVEMSLDGGIRNGKAASSMARDLRQFLKEPDRVYRRFQMYLRDDNGNPVLDSKGNKIMIKQQRKQVIDPATGKATWIVEKPPYKPGRGIYKSSYKNAHRLARTEQNMAYRASDHERMQQLDFVVGNEIKTSGNHPVIDICDTLAGKYPKDFKFTGWHPQCRCRVIHILKTIDELEEDTQKILDGDPTDTASINEITKLPGNFEKWVIDNSDRISNGQSIPYFIKDNFFLGDITKGIDIAPPKVNQVAAAKAAKVQKAADQAKEDALYNTSVPGTTQTLSLPDNQLITGEVKRMDINKIIPSEDHAIADNATAADFAKGEWYTLDANGKETFYSTGKWVNPNQVPTIVVDKNGLIIDGNNRYAAAKFHTKLKELNVIQTEFTRDEWIAGYKTIATKEAEHTAIQKLEDAIAKVEQQKMSDAALKVNYYKDLAAKKITEAQKLGVSGSELDALAAMAADDKATYSQIKGKIDKLNKITDVAKAEAKIAKATTATQKVAAMDSLSDEALLQKFTQDEVDKLHKAHDQFISNISHLDLAGQIKKVDFEIDWIAKNGKYSTSSTLSDLLKKDLISLKAKQEYEIAFSEAKAMIAQYGKVGTVAVDTETTKAITKLVKTIQKQPTLTELNTAIGEASKEIRAFNLKQASKIKTVSALDAEFFENEKDPFSLSKFYTADEKNKVKQLRDSVSEAIVKSKGDLRNYNVRSASDTLAEELERLGTKYLPQQKSFKHIKMEVTNGDSVAKYITNAEAKAEYINYLKLKPTGSGWYSYDIGGVYKPSTLTDENRYRAYVAKINAAGGNIVHEASVPMRYTRGATFINEYVSGANKYPESKFIPALDSYTGALSHSLNKLPRYNGITYRGISKNDELWADLLDAVQNKKPFVHKLGMSTATDAKGADSFGHQITMKIYGRSGVRVEEFSEFSGEREVLFRPGSKFEILEMYQSQSDNDIASSGNWVVILKEILE
ncbi:MAG: ADP-ribosyltransferase domain-containing protein [Bacteroidia bacterium]|nr:ADP-ribosyltransferase domain-containing protein [Bacteroidia bacterium]